ncbi:MAG: hypothetical protein A2W33_06205 [Chloroflexi bacterium RBG_16_52_11]|nr:MAG: hypothetical protein A2W33_06205 [Chloroflexi bacterium RBG_16_52_11]
MKHAQSTSQAILVTGAHRTGTTWVGKMLAAGGEAAYISEPLNIWHRPGVLRVPTRHWYTYLCTENEADYLPALRETLGLHYQAWAEIRSLRSVKDFLRMGRDWSAFLIGKLLRKHPLLKDPFAVFSTAWFASRLDCRVVITVRHPAAFASSLKRLDWPFQFADLLEQPLLMRDRLSPYQDAMQAVPPDDVIGQGSLLWKIIYQSVSQERKAHADYLLVRHEDLSREPVDEFRLLYDKLGLSFNRKAEKAIRSTSSTANPGEIPSQSAHSIKVNSQSNLSQWKQRLTAQEIERIRQITADVAAVYYPEEAWE